MNISHWTKIRKELKKTGCKVVFRFTPNLNSILCNNMSKLLLNSYPDVYQVTILEDNILVQQENVCFIDP